MSVRLLSRNGLSRAQVEAAIAAGIADMYPPLKAGQFIDHGLMYGGSLATTALTAGNLYGTPFAVPCPVTVDQIAIDVTTVTGEASLIRLGVGTFSGGAAWETTLVDDIGTVAGGGATGGRTLSYATTFEPGTLYVAYVLPESTPTVRGHRDSRNLFGANSATESLSRPGLMTSGHTFTGLAATETFTSANGIIPAVRFRVAS